MISQRESKRQLTFEYEFCPTNIGLGIRGTQVKSSIQDIVDEVASIKKSPLWG
jgi:hypothetical protein